MVRIQKDNFQNCINCHRLPNLLELDLASLDCKDSDGKALPSITVLGVRKKQMLAKGMKEKSQDSCCKGVVVRKYHPNKPRVAQHKLKCLLESFIVLPDKTMRIWMMREKKKKYT
jgi:hypothetical protein